MPQTLDLSFASKDESLTVRTFSIREEMSGLWTCDLVALSHSDDLDLSQFVGKGASFKINPELMSITTTRVYAGIVAEMDQVRVDTSANGLSTYALRIVPPLWRTTLRKNSRIFQHTSIPDIVMKVLAEWNIKPELKIQTAKYPKLEYKVQYMETDYAFVSRLLEEAGIAFWFSREEKTELQMTLADEPQNVALRSGGAIQYEDKPLPGSKNDYVTNVRMTQRVTPGHFTIRDYDFRQKPDYQLYQDFKAQGTKDAEDKYEQYVYQPGAFVTEPGKGGDTPVADDKGIARVDEKFGKGLAEQTLEGIRRDRLKVTLETSASDLVPGTVYSISKHPRKDLASDKKLLVTASMIDGGAGTEYKHSIESVFCEPIYRPIPRTPKPRVQGVQSAMVVGPKGEEIHTDEFGRIRVQFHWDREGKYDDMSSCWIRVSQAWAGFSYGMVMIPRVGHEVLVDFYEGDPDQPVVVGRVFNNTTRVPYKLPDHKTKSGWKTDSSPGSNGFNEISFDDAKGKELIHIQAEKDFTEIVKNDRSTTVLANRTASVTKNDSTTVGGDQAITVDGNQNTNVGKSMTFDVGENRRSVVGGTDVTQVKTEHAVSVGSGAGITITEKQIILTTGGATIVLTADSILLSATGGIGQITNGQFKLSGGLVTIDGGPDVKINTVGATPAQAVTITKVDDPKKPSGPGTGGDVSSAAPLLAGHGTVEKPEGFEEAVSAPHKTPADVPKKLEMSAALQTTVADATKGALPVSSLKDSLKKAIDLAKTAKQAVDTKGKSLLQLDSVKGEIGKLATQPLLGKVTGADVADLLNEGEKFGILKIGKKTQGILDYVEGATPDHANNVEQLLGAAFSKPVIGDASVGDLAGLATEGANDGLFKMGSKTTSALGQISTDVGAADKAKAAATAAKGAADAAKTGDAASDQATLMMMRTDAAPPKIDGSLIDDHAAAYRATGMPESAAFSKALSLQGVAMYAETSPGQLAQAPIPV